LIRVVVVVVVNVNDSVRAKLSHIQRIVISSGISGLLFPPSEGGTCKSDSLKLDAGLKAR